MKMEKPCPTVRMNLWLETGDGMFFGLGRMLLLKKIEEHGSLKKAAEDLGMSYRAAWGKIKKSEEVLGEKLTQRSPYKKEGFELTDFGRSIKEGFERWFDAIEKDAVEKARELFPWPIKAYTEPPDK